MKVQLPWKMPERLAAAGTFPGEINRKKVQWVISLGHS